MESKEEAARRTHPKFSGNFPVGWILSRTNLSAMRETRKTKRNNMNATVESFDIKGQNRVKGGARGPISNTGDGRTGYKLGRRSFIKGLALGGAALAPARAGPFLFTETFFSRKHSSSL